MSSEKVLRNIIENLESEIKQKNSLLADAKKELAELLCPFEVGDIVVNLVDKRAQCKRARVMAIIPPKWDGRPYGLELMGIKKDGSDYASSHVPWKSQEWTKEAPTL